MQHLQRYAAWLIGGGLVAIIAVTFVTSFDAIRAVAAESGAVSPDLAWAIPVGIDGLIVVGSAVAWVEATRDRWHPFPIAVVAAAAGLSVAANIAHAQSAELLARLLAASPPVALLLAVELGAWWLRRSQGIGEDVIGEVARAGFEAAQGGPVYPIDEHVEDMNRAAAAAAEYHDRPVHTALMTVPTHRHTTSGGGDGVLEPVDDGDDPWQAELWQRLAALPADDRTGAGERKLARLLDTTRHQISRLRKLDPGRYSRLTA